MHTLTHYYKSFICNKCLLDVNGSVALTCLLQTIGLFLVYDQFFPNIHLLYNNLSLFCRKFQNTWCMYIYLFFTLHVNFICNKANVMTIQSRSVSLQSLTLALYNTGTLQEQAIATKCLFLTPKWGNSVENTVVKYISCIAVFSA